MMEPRMRVHVPDWQLERFLLRELPQEEMEDVRRIVEEDDTLRARLEALEYENVEILKRYPPRLIAATIRAKQETLSPSRAVATRPFALRRAWIAALAVVTVAAGLSFLRPTQEADREAFESGTRIKGLRPRLLLFRQTASGVESLAPGGFAQENDVIQLAYQAAGRHYGVIVSIDGRGVVTQHMPKQGTSAVTLDTVGPMALSEAYRLDDAPRFERFILVASDEPFDVAVVLTAARRMLTDDKAEQPERLPLPRSFDQFTFMLNKESS